MDNTTTLSQSQIKILLNAKEFIRDHRDEFIEHLFCVHPEIACNLIENFEKNRAVLSSAPVLLLMVNGCNKTIPGEIVKIVRSMVESDRRVEAIKHLRDYAGIGLKEAKDAIESGVFGYPKR